jgi:hypothetical protein
MSGRTGLRRSLVAGAVYDLALGIFVLTVGPAVMARLGHPLSGAGPYYFRLAALPLCILPVVYLSAARSPQVDAFRAPVLGLRVLGGGLVLASLLLGPQPASLFLAIGLGDLAWAGLHAFLWRGSR